MAVCICSTIIWRLIQWGVNNLIDGQELLDIIDRIKKQIQDNTEPDGSCLFNTQEVKWILQLTEKTLQDSVNSYIKE